MFTLRFSKYITRKKKLDSREKIKWYRYIKFIQCCQSLTGSKWSLRSLRLSLKLFLLTSVPCLVVLEAALLFEKEMYHLLRSHHHSRVFWIRPAFFKCINLYKTGGIIRDITPVSLSSLLERYFCLTRTASWNKHFFEM